MVGEISDATYIHREGGADSSRGAFAAEYQAHLLLTRHRGTRPNSDHKDGSAQPPPPNKDGTGQPPPGGGRGGIDLDLGGGGHGKDRPATPTTPGPTEGADPDGGIPLDEQGRPTWRHPDRRLYRTEVPYSGPAT
jgi:hypothetical protein